MQFTIRKYVEEDWPEVWGIIEPIFRAGDSYPCDPNISENDAYIYWVEKPIVTFVATDESEEMVGTYYIVPDQPGLGSHICNCGYIVSQKHRRRGVGRELCLDSQKKARHLSFKGVRFNLVVSTNLAAVACWTKAGMEIVGTVPKSFKHVEHGYVSTFVMFKWIE